MMTGSMPMMQPMSPTAVPAFQQGYDNMHNTSLDPRQMQFMSTDQIEEQREQAEHSVNQNIADQIKVLRSKADAMENQINEKFDRDCKMIDTQLDMQEQQKLMVYMQEYAKERARYEQEKNVQEMEINRRALASTQVANEQKMQRDMQASQAKWAEQAAAASLAATEKRMAMATKGKATKKEDKKADKPEDKKVDKKEDKKVDKKDKKVAKKA